MTNFIAERNQIYCDLKELYPNWVFMSVVGSHNYGTATDKSDIDVKMVVMPTFKEFYYNKFNRTSKGGPDTPVDYTCHPLHEYIRHSFKGNMNFWEVFFSNNLTINDYYPDLRELLPDIRDAIRENFVPNFNANLGMAIQKHNSFLKMWDLYNSQVGTDHFELWLDRLLKEAQHSIRILEFLSAYANGRFTIKSLCSGDYLQIRSWKNIDPSRKTEYCCTFQRLLDEVRGYEDWFKHNFDGVDKTVFDNINIEIYNIIKRSM